MRALISVALWLAVLVASGAFADDMSVAARVNRVEIPVAAVQRLADKIAQGAQLGTDRVWNDARDQLVTQEVLVQAAKAEGFKVSAGEVDTDLAEFKSELGGADEFQKTLKESHASEAEFRLDTERGLLVQKLLERHVAVKVTPQEIEDFYKENPEQFERPVTVRASHILFRVAGGDTAAARKRAEDALARAKQGEDFAKLAQTLSEDPLTVKKGGDLGFFPQRSTPVAEAAFRLKPGEISDIVESTYGLHIIKLIETRPPGIVPLAEVRDDVRELLEDEQRDTKDDEFIEQLKKKAKIQILQQKPADPKAAQPPGAAEKK